MPTIAGHETEGREVDALRERHHLEELAHLVLVDELHGVGALADVDARHQLAEAAVEEEARLRGVAGDVEPGVLPGERERGEVEVRRDVLGADVDQRVGVGAVGAVAHERAARALRMVVLGLGKTVVDEEGGAALEAVGERRDEGFGLGMQLGDGAGGQAIGERWPAGGRVVGPGERRRIRASDTTGDDTAFEPLLTVEVDEVDRHRVEHLVADDDAAHRIGQRLDPFDAIGIRGRRFALARTQRRRDLDDPVAPDPIAELPEQHRCERARAGAELPHLVAVAGFERLRDLPGQRPPEQRRQLGRGHEVAARRRHPPDPRPARVVAEAGRVERERHEAAERQPAAALLDGAQDEAPKGRRYTALVGAFVHRRIVGIVLTTIAPPAPLRTKLPVEIAKLSKRLHAQVGSAIADFSMIETGDRVMVCVSGGKDSYSLLDILLRVRERSPVAFEIVAVNLDQKQPGFPEQVLPAYLASLGVEHRIVAQDTYSVVKRLVPEGKTMCSLCSRLRRGALYRIAGEIGATKIALGHHRDDMVQTFFMNMFFGGRLKGMPPKLVSDDGRHVVIRPLAYAAETDLARWAAHKRFPIIPCNLCGSQQNLQRVKIRAMLGDWEREHPGRIDRIFAAMGTVVPSHLMDRNLFAFAGLEPTGVADPSGDRAFDPGELP